MSSQFLQPESGRRDPPNHALLQQIISTLTHDLRTPLGTITNYTSFLIESPTELTEQVRDVLGLIRRNTGRAVKMVQCVDEALEVVRRFDAEGDREARVDWTGFLNEVLSISPRLELSSETVVDCSTSDRGLYSFACRAYLGVVLSASEDLNVSLQFAVAKGSGSLRLSLTCRPNAPQAGASRIGEPPTSVRDFLAHDRGLERQAAAMPLELASAIVESRGGVLLLRGHPEVESSLNLDMPDRPARKSGDPEEPTA